MSKQVIESWKTAQALAPVILQRLHDDPPLLMAALSNPLLALEELGYEIAPPFREELTTRARFSKRDAVKIRQLEEAIFKHAGRRFPLDSPAEIERVLFEDLTLPRSSGVGKEKDPLEALRGQHPVVDALIEYRRLNARAPGLAPRKLFDEIRAGKHRLPVTRVHVRFKPRDAAEALRE